MIRATTPQILCRIKDADLTGAESVYVTIRQYNRELTLSGEDLSVSVDDGTTFILFHLTQAAAIGFYEGKAEIQVNWIYDTSKRGATKPATFSISKQLLERILP